MKKSVVSLLAIATIAVSTLTACGTNTANQSNTSSKNSDATSTSEAENTVANSADSESAAENAPAPTTEDNQDVTEAQTGFTSSPSNSDNWSSIDAQAKYQTHRIGSHEEYDRVVVEYKNDSAGKLSWASEGWADEVIEDGRGLPYDLDSKRAIQIIVGGLSYTEEGDPEIKELNVPADSAIKKVIVSYPFEGYHLINIGRDSDAPYRVTLLENPTRIVVDIQK